MMGAIGTGNVVPGAVTASFGTSGTIYAYARKPVVDPAGEIAAFCSSTGGWLPLLCTMNVTGVTEQVRALFGWSLAELEAVGGSRSRRRRTASSSFRIWTASARPTSHGARASISVSTAARCRRGTSRARRSRARRWG